MTKQPVYTFTDAQVISAMGASVAVRRTLMSAVRAARESGQDTIPVTLLESLAEVAAQRYRAIAAAIDPDAAMQVLDGITEHDKHHPHD